MLLKGNLSSTTLPEILHSICVSRETGLLVLQQFSITKKIYFEEGLITFAYSNQRRDSLGDVLLRNGVVTLEQYLDTAKQIAPGLRHGQILVQQGIITPRELSSALNAQVRDIIFSLFSWTEGMFEFILKEKALESIRLNTASSNLILAGVMTLADWTILEMMIGGIDSVLDSSPDFESKLSELKLSDQERDIARYAPGRPVREVLRYSLMNDFHTCRLLSGFVTIDLLRLRKAHHLVLEPVQENDAGRLVRTMEVFEQIFSMVSRTMTDLVGPLASKVLSGYYHEIRMESGALLQNVDMAPDGTLDTDILELNLLTLRVPDKAAHVYTIFSRILDSQLKAVRELAGEEATRALEERIKVSVSRLTRRPE